MTQDPARPISEKVAGIIFFHRNKDRGAEQQGCVRTGKTGERTLRSSLCSLRSGEIPCPHWSPKVKGNVEIWK